MPLRSHESVSETTTVSTGTVEATKTPAPRKKAKKKPKREVPHGKVWSKKELEYEIRKACKSYHISKKDTEWLVRSGIDIVYTGVHESSGGIHTKNGGMWQYGDGWHSTKSIKKRARVYHHNHGKCGWKHCGYCATRRYVKSFKDGGKSAIRSHWRATLGR